MPAIQLGFVEQLDEDEGKLTATINDFPNKIGGAPIWLNPAHLLKADQLLCGVCGKVMVLLMQFYTPEDSPPEAFHRVIYLFCCKDGGCHKRDWKKCFKAYRSQLPEQNRYYNPVEGPKQEACIPIVKTCSVCGIDGSKHCSRCKSVQYCSREHQLLDWNTGGHKAACKNLAAASSSPTSPPHSHPHTFKEYELVSEDEPPQPTTDGDDDEEDEDGEADVGVDAEADPDAAFEETKVVDAAFMKFQKRVDVEPEQVVRYARVSYEEGRAEPLWVSDTGRPGVEDVGICPWCGGERTFEFQVMPQLLTFLSIDHSSPDALDWGTVAVYSCIGNCQPKSGGAESESDAFVEEVVWRQEFCEQGMGDVLREAHEKARKVVEAREKGDEVEEGVKRGEKIEEVVEAGTNNVEKEDEGKGEKEGGGEKG